MFSNRIANSAKFLQMPTEAQLLYFHMVMRADDDGIVEAYPLLKLLSVPPDNFKVLITKGFVRQLNEDQVVVITEWLEHNTIRADRKVNSIYQELLIQNHPDIKIIAPKPRSDVEDNSKRLSGPSTGGISQVKLSKDKIIHTIPAEKNSARLSKFDPLGAEIIKAFEEVDPKNKTYYNNTTQRGACDFLLKEYGLEEVLKRITVLPKTNKVPFFPKINSPNDLKEKWVKLQDAVDAKRAEIKSSNKIAF